jgi:hypothetical protein
LLREGSPSLGTLTGTASYAKSSPFADSRQNATRRSTTWNQNVNGKTRKGNKTAKKERERKPEKRGEKEPVGTATEMTTTNPQKAQIYAKLNAREIISYVLTKQQGPGNDGRICISEDALLIRAFLN